MAVGALFGLPGPWVYSGGHRLVTCSVTSETKIDGYGLNRTKTRVRASSAMAPHLPDADRPSHATLTARPETSQVPM